MTDSLSLTDAAVPPAELQAIEHKVGKARTSFYAAMRILPEPRRNAMYAVYAFCREVDDIADEPAALATKHTELDAWRRDIARLYAGETPVNPVARALAQPISRFDLQRGDFEAVIDGMQMDADADIQAPTLAELDLYCDRVASAVGRLSVRIFGPWEPAADEVAKHLGRALQLTNILRDVDEDGARGRLYLPRELLARSGVALGTPSQVLDHPALAEVCEAVSTMAREHFAMADAALRRCRRRSMRPARMMAGVYRALLDRLIRRGWAAPRHPVRMTKLAKLWIALRCAIF